MDFTLERRPSGRQGVTLLVASGDIDMTAAREFGRRLEGGLRASTDDVVLDLAAVVYLDSTALRALVGCRKIAEERDSRLALAGPPRPVLHVLEVTGLRELFEVHPDTESAFEAIGRPNQPKR